MIIFQHSMLRSIQFLRMHFLHMFLHVIENITNEKLMQQSFIYGGGDSVNVDIETF